MASDQTTLKSHKRSRQTLLMTQRALKKPKGAPYPQHEPWQVVHYAIKAAAAVAGVSAPGFNDDSDPRQVYLWMCKTVIEYGKEREEEGARMVRDSTGPRLGRELHGPALKLMGQLNDLLSTR